MHACMQSWCHRKRNGACQLLQRVHCSSFDKTIDQLTAPLFQSCCDLRLVCCRVCQLLVHAGNALIDPCQCFLYGSLNLQSHRQDTSGARAFNTTNVWDCVLADANSAGHRHYILSAGACLRHSAWKYLACRYAAALILLCRARSMPTVFIRRPDVFHSRMFAASHCHHVCMSSILS